MSRPTTTNVAARTFAVIAFAAGASVALAQKELPGYCVVETAHDALLVRPGASEDPIGDINWFARPVPNPENHWIVGYAMHDQNYLYNLTTGQRVAIPDKSDAVATPDGKYMTVPAYYTPDGFVRFYDTSVLIDHLKREEDASDVSPVFIHEHEGLRDTFYQSLGHIESKQNTDVYRMIFSGTSNESGFRMVDYRFETTGHGLIVTPTEPIALCPEIENDLMTPFVSKDGQYVAAYTSPISAERYTAGASLKIFRISDVDYDNGHSSCNEVVDFGFPAGKADFSFDGNSLTFHISNVSYLAVFINGGRVFGQSDDAGTLNTDVMVANLKRDEHGTINGVTGVRRLTTTQGIGAGSYFPAFFPDGNLFYIRHPLPKADEVRRFEFQVVDPDASLFDENLYSNAAAIRAAAEIGALWTSHCGTVSDYSYAEHELPFFIYSMTAEQCRALVYDADGVANNDRPRLAGICSAVLN